MDAGREELRNQCIKSKPKKTTGYNRDHLPKKTSGHSNLLNIYLQSCEWRGLSPRTVKIYQDKVGAFLNSLPDPNKEPQPEDVLSFVGAMRKRGWKPGGVSIYVRSMKSFFRWGVQQGLLESNPLDDLPPLTQARPPLIETLNPSAIQRLIDAAYRLNRNAKRNACILYLLLDCALRPGELRSLQLQDVNLELNTIKVEGKVGQRQLPFSSPTRKSILAWLRQRPNIPGEDSLFLQRGGEPLSKTGLRCTLRYLRKKARLPETLNPYKLRHTSATTFLRNGGSMEAVRMLLGHTSYSCTQRYLSLNHADLAKAQRKYSPVRNLR